MPYPNELAEQFVLAMDSAWRAVRPSGGRPPAPEEPGVLSSDRWRLFFRVLRVRLGTGWMLPFSDPPRGARTYQVMFWDRPALRLHVVQVPGPDGERCYSLEILRPPLEPAATRGAGSGLGANTHV
jgi:hypothetical protein